MLGLLKLTELDSSLGVLAPGIDLSRQHLDNLPPPGQLHNSFTSPLADQYTLPPHEAEYDMPEEYRIHHRVVGRLPSDPPLDKLTDEILFWVFYNLCREEAQLIAAKELYTRGWRYHKKKMWWLTHVPGSEVIREGGREQSTYYCWDPLNWRKVTQRLTICYADLDDTPTTYQLSSSTLNARVIFASSGQHKQ
ncbi:hypothetical protein TcWFU_005976 [Taenia crassiceps]|uniref:NOT2/NOT3/NOT5 C-terminal domain-containing protein n=1 Tax=Taenia crassiceps TaxID=6207 RepID=A0ABR4QAS7_9CEST